MYRELGPNNYVNISQVNIPAYHACLTNGFTIVVSSYDRLENLDITLRHWQSCPGVAQIDVVWHHPELTIEARQYPSLVNFRYYPDNKLTNRFRVPENGQQKPNEPSGFQTTAIFSVDDDVMIDCGVLAAGFCLWCHQEAQGEPAVVGFEPRDFDIVTETPKNPSGYSWNDSCKGNCTFNTVWVTKGAFLHAQYHALFWDTAYTDLRTAVNEWTTGEDMLMSAILMAHQVPVLVLHPAPDYTQLTPQIPIEVRGKHVSLGERTSSRRSDVRRLLQQYFSNEHLRWTGTSRWHLLYKNRTVKALEQPCKALSLTCSH